MRELPHVRVELKLLAERHTCALQAFRRGARPAGWKHKKAWLQPINRQSVYHLQNSMYVPAISHIAALPLSSTIDHLFSSN
jgi:hypothetical protein